MDEHMHFRQVSLEDVDWAALDRYPDRTHSQRLPWLRYLTAIGAGSPVVALLEDGGRTVGCFTGIRGRRLGIPTLGSPIPGWNTSYMRSEEHTSELQLLMRISYAVFCLTKKNKDSNVLLT